MRFTREAPRHDGDDMSATTIERMPAGCGPDRAESENAVSLTRRGFVGATLGAAALLTARPAMAEPTGSGELVVHYYSPTWKYDDAVRAVALTGEGGARTGVERDEFGMTYTFSFSDTPPQGHLGFTVRTDAVFPDDLRYVQAAGGRAEVWVIDADPHVYSAPRTIAARDVTTRQDTPYVAVEDLAELLDLTYEYGTNGYEFDGAGAGTLEILTIHRGRDHYEIAVDRDRIGSNVTGNMLRAYTDLVFDDVDGHRSGDTYRLSFGALERLFQVRTLSLGTEHLLLIPVDVAHDVLRSAAPSAVGFDEDRLAELDSFIEGQVEDGSPAVALIVARSGKVIKEDAYGYALRYSTHDSGGETLPAELLPEDRWEPATTDTLFDLASNTKMYATNYALQRLVSQGRLDLDSPVASLPGWEAFRDESTEYTGDWTVGGEGGIEQAHTGKDTITIRDLLHHRGGLIPDPQYQNLLVAGELWYQTTDAGDRSGVIDAICRTPLMYAPRTRFAYSDVDFMILGLIVEQVTGRRLDEYLAEEFYEPLGLTGTCYRPLDSGMDPHDVAATELNGNTRDGNVSFGTHPDGSEVRIRDHTLRGEVHDEKAFYAMAGVAGHAGLFSTTSDMAVLTQLMLNDGIHAGRQYFTGDVIDEFTTPFAPDPADADTSTIGLGWRVHSRSAAAYYYFNWGPSRSTVGHQGWTGTLTVIDPLHDMTITILTNMRHSPVIDPPNGFAGAEYAVSDLVPITARVYRALSTTTTRTPTLAGLEAALEDHIAAGEVAGPIAHQLQDAVSRAKDHLTAGRTRPAVAALQQVLRHLEDPKNPDTLTDTAREDLHRRTEEILAAIG